MFIVTIFCPGIKLIPLETTLSTSTFHKLITSDNLTTSDVRMSSPNTWQKHYTIPGVCCLLDEA